MRDSPFCRIQSLGALSLSDKNWTLTEEKSVSLLTVHPLNTMFLYKAVQLLRDYSLLFSFSVLDEKHLKPSFSSLCIALKNIYADL